MRPLALLLLAPWLTAASATSHLVERDGLVAFEVELHPVRGQWAAATGLAGASGQGYLLNRSTSKAPGSDPLVYPFLVTTAGTYQVQVRSRIGEGDSTTESNDSFLRLTNATGVAVQPVPDRTVATDGWYKIYQNVRDAWTWNTGNRDHDPRALAWNLSAGTVYQLHLSRRSQGHALDRVVLWDRARHDLGNDKGVADARQSAVLDATPATIGQVPPTTKPRRDPTR